MQVRLQHLHVLRQKFLHPSLMFPAPSFRTQRIYLEIPALSIWSQGIDLLILAPGVWSQQGGGRRISSLLGSYDKASCLVGRHLRLVAAIKCK